MLETLRVISYMVWIGVGVTIIWGMFWQFRLQKTFMTNMYGTKKNDGE